jgi:hypothetical protein
VTNLEQRLTQVLAVKSADAPPADGLAEAVRSRHLRRRRSQLGGAAVALMAVLVPAGVIGHGLTHNDPSQPEPLGSYKYGQHRATSDAVPAAQAPGFHTLDYGVPSHSPTLGGNGESRLAPIGEYLDIDARGRLAAMRVHLPSPAGPSATYQLVPGPHRPVRQVPAPVSDTMQFGLWAPSFTSDGRLLWSTQTGGPWIDDRLTDLAGGNVQQIVPALANVPVPSTVAGHPWRGVWIDGGRVWFSAVTKVDSASDDQAQWVSLFSFDPAHPEQLRREAATDVTTIDVASGEAVWIDGTDTKVFAEDLATHDVHQVPVPFDAGCRLVPTSDFTGGSFAEAIVTNGSLVALTEFCPDWRTSREVVTDLSGRLVTDIDAGSGHQIYDVALSDQTITFIVQGPTGLHDNYLGDLVSGEMVALGSQKPGMELSPHVAGRYVLWYAGPGGHVGRLAAK